MLPPDEAARRKAQADNPNGGGAPELPDVGGMSHAEAAEAYAKAGICLVPIRPGTKNPGSYLGRGWPARATCDLDIVRDWWRRWPDAGIAIHVGGCLLLVVDVDKPENVPDWLWPLLERAVFRRTMTDPESRRGHYFYRLRPGEMFDNGLGQLKMPKGKGWGEIKCYGGAVVLAPTVHPKADEGHEYHSGPTEAIPYRPDELADKLNAAPDADEWRVLTPGELDAKAAAFLAEYTDDKEPYALDPICRSFDPTPSSRHPSLWDALCWAMREAKAGRYPAQRAVDALRYLWTEAIGGEYRDGDTDEFDRMLRDAIATADADGTVAELWARAHRNDELPTDAEMAAFWAARPVLRHIYASSLAQQMDPRGVLAVHLVRAICSIPPYVTLPGITAARASLNLHVALVGPSSGGKSSSVGVARQAIAVTPEPEVTTLGSAEGIAKQYAYRDSKTKEIVTVTDTLLFNDTEIESVEALSKRAGNPLMSQWRKTFTGEQLGFGYADPKNRIPVRGHTYRFCQVLGIQPELAGWLLDGIQASAGTPQRILWAPVVYPQMPRPEDLPTWPGQKVLPKWPEPIDEHTTEMAGGAKIKWPYQMAVDQEANENMLRQHELGVPEDVEAMIREARYKFHHGETDSYGGHSTLTRLKVAAGLMWLEGRTDKITEEDWDLAGVVMKVSNATRADVHAALGTEAGKVNKRRGHAEAEREEAKEEHKYDKAIARVSERIRDKLRANNGQAKAVLRRQFPRDKEYVDEALARLVAVGDIELKPIAGQGRTGHTVWLKEGR